MAREPIPTYCFALVVVRLGRRFLLVHERKHGQGWYLPAGRVEPGESFEAAALRETLEESGVPVVLEGVLRVPGRETLHGACRARPARRATNARPLSITSVARGRSCPRGQVSGDRPGDHPGRSG